MKINEIIITEDFDEYDPRDIASPVPSDAPPEVRQVDNYEDLARIIETHCGQMLSVYRDTEKLLWRGIKSIDRVIILNIRPDRKPVEMGSIIHDKLETAFTLVGLKANRKNSIFCTADANTASVWGNQYIIFVKDGWSGTVFPRMYNRYSFYKLQSMAKDIITYPTLSALADGIRELEPLIVTPQNLGAVLYNDAKDILITGSSYIGLRYGTPAYEKVMGLLDLNID